MEQYEIATVTAVGKPGTQAYLAMDARAGASSIKVTSASDISVGDKIRLDIDSVGHGIETVAVAQVGTAATKTNLTANASAGATRVNVRRAEGFAVGDKITIGTPASQEDVTVTAIGSRGRGGVALDFTPALAKPHVTDEWVVSPGTGLDLGAPLQYNHAANLPFSDRGTGISFQPATAFAHSSNEPVQALGTGITLDRPLTNTHAIHEVVRDEAVKTAGYQGTPAPNQWFGGPELTTNFPIFGRTITIEEGSMVLRNASGVVADSLNYGAIADPWAAEGYQAASGASESGCYAPAPGATLELWSIVPSPIATNTSGGRFPDGADTDSNCNDFLTQAAASLSTASPAGATNIKVDSVEGFSAGQKSSLIQVRISKMPSSLQLGQQVRLRCAMPPTWERLFFRRPTLPASGKVRQSRLTVGRTRRRPLSPRLGSSAAEQLQSLRHWLVRTRLACRFPAAVSTSQVRWPGHMPVERRFPTTFQRLGRQTNTTGTIIKKVYLKSVARSRSWPK